MSEKSQTCIPAQMLEQAKREREAGQMHRLEQRAAAVQPDDHLPKTNQITPAMHGWYTPQELADLPGLPGTEQGVRKRAKRESWESRRRPGSKAREYPIGALPAEAQRVLLRVELEYLLAIGAQESAAAADLDAEAAIARIDRLEALLQVFAADVAALKRMLGGSHD